jgi:hypothetical protein
MAYDTYAGPAAGALQDLVGGGDAGRWQQPASPPRLSAASWANCHATAAARSAVDSQSRISDISMHAERSVDQGKYSNTTRRHMLKRHIAVVAMHFPTVRCSCPSHPSLHVPRSRADAACLAPHPPPWPPREWTKVPCFARCCKGHMCWI